MKKEKETPDVPEIIVPDQEVPEKTGKQLLGYKNYSKWSMEVLSRSKKKDGDISIPYLFDNEGEPEKYCNLRKVKVIREKVTLPNEAVELLNSHAHSTLEYYFPKK